MAALNSITEFAQGINDLINTVPLWLWQVAGSLFLTIVLMQMVKMFEPSTWEPVVRRKVNLGLSMATGAGVTIWLYDQSAKDFVVAAVMISNNFLYSGLAALVQRKAEKENGFWTVLLGFIRPHTKRVKQGNVIKEVDAVTDETIITYAQSENEALDAPSELKRVMHGD